MPTLRKKVNVVLSRFLRLTNKRDASSPHGCYDGDDDARKSPIK